MHRVASLGSWSEAQCKHPDVEGTLSLTGRYKGFPDRCPLVAPDWVPEKEAEDGE